MLDSVLGSYHLVREKANSFFYGVIRRVREDHFAKLPPPLTTNDEGERQRSGAG
jgi:hypothetical protein